MIRIAELKALCWDDIDWNEKTLYIQRQSLIEHEMQDDLTFAPRKTVLSDQIKGYTSHGFRKLPLTPEAVRILKQARELNPTGKCIFMPHNRIMTSDTFNSRLKKYCKEAGMNIIQAIRYASSQHPQRLLVITLLQ